MNTRTLLLMLVWMTWASSGQAQDSQSPMLTLSEPWFQAGATEHTWNYEVQLGRVTGETTFILDLRVPECVRVDVDQDGVTSSRRRSPFTEVTITVERDTNVSLVMTGPAGEVQHGPAVEHRWRVDDEGNGDTRTLRVSAPERRYDPSLVRVVLGIGGSWLNHDFVEFDVSEDGEILRVLNDSKTRATATIGALFNVPGPLDVLASFHFTEQTANVLDGAMFGLAWELNPYLSIGGGYVIRKGRELAPGFRRHAKAAIEASPKQYKVFEEILFSDDDSLYDGFPLKGENGPVFDDHPVTDSTNHSWFLGVFVPLDFRQWFTTRAGS